MSAEYADTNVSRAHWPPESVQVHTLVPLPLREKLKARAKKNGLGIQAFLKVLILRELDLEEECDVEADSKPRRRVALPMLRPEAPNPFRTDPGSIADLVARGFNANQIAAIKRMPYRDVLAQLGAQIDALVEKQESKSPNKATAPTVYNVAATIVPRV